MSNIPESGRVQLVTESRKEYQLSLGLEFSVIGFRFLLLQLRFGNKALHLDDLLHGKVVLTICSEQQRQEHARLMCKRVVVTDLHLFTTIFTTHCRPPGQRNVHLLLPAGIRWLTTHGGARIVRAVGV